MPDHYPMYDQKALRLIREAVERWAETDVQRSTAQVPERRDPFITASARPVRRL